MREGTYATGKKLPGDGAGKGSRVDIKAHCSKTASDKSIKDVGKKGK